MASDDGQQLLVHLQDNTAPASGAIEITTRDRIFAPHRRGLGYIHVEGFVFERCATRPGFPQLGALSTRTGQYWIIRNNIVRYTTGRGIDCGSETWNPESLIATEPEDKHVLIGGHHLVEGNLVTDNAQCGIAAWNTDDVRIIGNIVRNNCPSASADDHSLTDFEAGGIKVHCFRNGLIEGNLVVSNSSFGIWLDDGWENARVTRNVMHRQPRRRHLRRTGLRARPGGSQPLGRQRAAWARLTSATASIPTMPRASRSRTTRSWTMPTMAVEQIVVSERVYWPKRMAEASNETITGNLFYGNRDGAIFAAAGFAALARQPLGSQRHRARRKLRHQQQQRPHPHRDDSEGVSRAIAGGRCAGEPAPGPVGSQALARSCRWRRGGR